MKRLVSLIPSATEICFALGLDDQLVGVSHECDFPAEASTKRSVTSSEAHTGLSSKEIDLLVRSQLDETGSIYDLDLKVLEELRPDVIFTQRLCTVCAVGYDHVKATVEQLSHRPLVVNLEPSTLSDVIDSFGIVAASAGCPQEATEPMATMAKRFKEVQQRCCELSKPKVLFLEWCDPPFASGHWIPQLISTAGATLTIVYDGSPSREITHEMIDRSEPDIVIVAECGFDVARQRQDIPPLLKRLNHIPSEVWIADGSQYFSRPGPRLVESVKMLAGIIHPELRDEYLPPFIAKGQVEKFFTRK